ncbi:endonuclease/exonuclease/phosphatase family protein [Cellulomonas sp.]|uniref:endonuclease/exonuclease/phosphatase family protein n=1 Tax=Cellulomonas sp. TaxID=40001 RepID=UPI002589130E|nr:endonuclease/exonuclease/phosphatase family protein [Cellulomonas sp.]MCR6690109.1 endonuclease/exonuclease/phosphatase family protein [Cellulomonas sp.]
MRLASFNALHGLRPGDDAADPSRWPDVVAALDADVLALQEVDRAQPRSGGIDMTAVAADALGATDARFVPTLLGRPGRWRDARDPGADGPAHGIALLSRHPVTEWRTVALPQRAGRTWVRSAGRLLPRPHRDRPRHALVAVVDSPVGAVTVVATHLTYLRGQNVAQLRHLVAATADLPRPLVLLGDLNVGPSTATGITGWIALVTAPTYPSHSPTVQIDHVLVDGPLRAVTSGRAVDTGLSDHRALVVDVTQA